MVQSVATKRPVMLFDVQEQKIYAYPYKEFKAEMNQRSQASLRDQYQRARRNNHVVVFVRDNDNQKLLAFTMDPAVM